jgi:hypothetical protein
MVFSKKQQFSGHMRNGQNTGYFKLKGPWSKAGQQLAKEFLRP